MNKDDYVKWSECILSRATHFYVRAKIITDDRITVAFDHP